MGKHLVKVWSKECEVSTNRTSDTVWRASGEYMNEIIETKGRTESAALKKWRSAATYKGN